MRFLADSNIVAQAVRALRAAGHDVLYLGERTTDRGDQAFLAEAVTEGRIILTKLLCANGLRGNRLDRLDG